MMKSLAEEHINIPHGILRDFCIAVLKNRSVKDDVLYHVVESLIQTSLRGVDSHGIELLPHYICALDAGRINPDPKYRYTTTAQSTGKLDADHTFGHAAGAEGMVRAVEMARTSGIGAIAVYNSTHFGAAAYFSFLASKQDMIGMSFAYADPLMLSYSGVRPFFGPNPICFTAPCENEGPFCLDMSTTLISWNKLRSYKAGGKEIPSDWACDEEGNLTTNPNEAVSLLPIGKYKGFGLSMMIDILCSLLSGMPFGRDITKMYTDPIEKKRYLGHFFIAIDIACFAKVSTFKKRLQEMMDAVRSEPAKNREVPVMVPGDPEKKMHEIRIKTGIPVSRMTYEKFKQISAEIGFELLK
ncbi:Ldh family oxidoreductase [bacterium]|nr:Ldh family oxidoreductase [bacterium]